MAFYGTASDAAAYHTSRGRGARWDALADPEAALESGSDYIDQRYRERLPSGRWTSMFVGTKVGGRAQLRAWPRVGGVDSNGDPVESDEVPIEVEFATYEAALRLGENPGSLSPDYVATSQAIKEKVGPVEVQYADTSATKSDDGHSPPSRPQVPVIDEILAPLLIRRYDLPAVMVV